MKSQHQATFHHTQNPDSQLTKKQSKIHKAGKYKFLLKKFKTNIKDLHRKS